MGQIFSRAEWEVGFVDIDRAVIDELNRKRGYTVEARDPGPVQRALVEQYYGLNDREEQPARFKQLCS